jgi:mevalonate kinase
MLRAIGVSSRELDEIVERALRAGAYGSCTSTSSTN